MNDAHLALMTVLNQLEVARSELSDSIDGFLWTPGWTQKLPISEARRMDKQKHAYAIIAKILNDAAHDALAERT